MKILLVDIGRIWISNVKVKFSEVKTVSKLKWLNPMACLLLGFMYLAAALNRKFGEKVELKIINTAVDCDSPEKLRNIVNNFYPDVVGLRALSMDKDLFNEIATLIKRFKKDAILIGGGLYPTCEPEDALKNVDIVVIGEGEETIVELIHAFLNNTEIRNISGIGFRENGKIVFTAPRKLLFDLDKIPLPNYSLIQFHTYENSKNMCRRQNIRYASLFTSRGCPYRCMYCHNIFGKKFRSRSPENVFAEIEYLYNIYGIKEFQIIDDTFNVDPIRAGKICDLIIKSKLELILSFPNGIRGDIISKQLIDKMVDAGTKYLFFAVESASPRIQRLTNKNLNLDRLLENINYASRKNCVTGGFFMMGFPSETEEEVNKTIEYAKATDLTTGYFFVVTYYPGTELYNLALKYGLNPEKYNVETNLFEPKYGVYNFSYDVLQNLYLKAHREFFFSDKRIQYAFQKLPLFFSSEREIRDIFIAQIIVSKLEFSEIEKKKEKRKKKKIEYRNRLKNYFEYAQKVKQLGIEFSF